MVYLGTYAVSFAVAAVLSYFIHSIIFKDAVMFQTQYEIGGIALSLPFERIVMCIICAFLLTVSLVALFGKKVIMKFMPAEMKNRAGDWYEKEQGIKKSRLSRVSSKAAGVVVLVFSVAPFLLSLSDIGFYDDHFKYLSDTSLSVKTVRYEDMSIYKLDGYYDEDEYYSYENAYAVGYDSGYYELGEVTPLGEAEKFIFEIADKYGKEIKEIKSVEELE